MVLALELQYLSVQHTPTLRGAIQQVRRRHLDNIISPWDSLSRRCLRRTPRGPDYISLARTPVFHVRLLQRLDDAKTKGVTTEKPTLLVMHLVQWCQARAKKHTTAASGLFADVAEHAHTDATALPNGGRGIGQDLVRQLVTFYSTLGCAQFHGCFLRDANRTWNHSHCDPRHKWDAQLPACRPPCQASLHQGTWTTTYNWHRPDGCAGAAVPTIRVFLV